MNLLPSTITAITKLNRRNTNRNDGEAWAEKPYRYRTTTPIETVVSRFFTNHAVKKERGDQPFEEYRFCIDNFVLMGTHAFIIAEDFLDQHPYLIGYRDHDTGTIRLDENTFKVLELSQMRTFIRRRARAYGWKVVFEPLPIIPLPVMELSDETFLNVVEKAVAIVNQTSSYDETASFNAIDNPTVHVYPQQDGPVAHIAVPRRAAH